MMGKAIEKTENLGTAALDAAKQAGRNIASAAEKGMEYVAEKTGLASEGNNKSISAIKEGMDVIASCGKKVGVVDRVEDNAIKLTRKDSSDNQHHFIPVNWIERVDAHVHLTKNSMEAQQNWKPSAADCSCS